MIWLKESSIPVDRPELLKLGVAVHALKLNQGIFAIEVNLILERSIQHYTIADNVQGFAQADQSKRPRGRAKTKIHLYL